MRMPNDLELRWEWVQSTRDQLLCARTATTTITPTPARHTASMDLSGSPAGSLLAPDRGSMAIAVTTAAVATTDVGRPLPDAGEFTAGTIAVTPAATSTVEMDSVAEIAPIVEVVSMEGETVSTVEPDIAEVASMAVVEAMEVDTGRLQHPLETLAADGKCRRPLRFGGRNSASDDAKPCRAGKPSSPKGRRSRVHR